MVKEKKDIRNILITNIYSSKNKGDAAIVISMIEDLKRQFPDANINLSTFDIRDSRKYGHYKIYPSILKIVRGKSNNKIIIGIKYLFFIFRIMLFEFFSLSFKIDLKILFSKEMQNKIESYKKMDLITACGGGYLITKEKFSIIEKTVFCYDFYLAHMNQKKFILYNQSIGPSYNKIDLYIIKRFIKKAQLIICREELSIKRLEELGITQTILSLDIAFNLKKIRTPILKLYEYKKNCINIGITVRRWLSNDLQKKYEKELSKFINTTINKNRKCFFYFMPQVIFEDNNDDDRVVAKKILAQIESSNIKNVKNIVEDLSPGELKYIISKMDYFIGTRMHSNIFALSSNIKTIGIVYEPKTRGIMKMLGMEHYIIEMDQVTSDNLLQKIREIRKDKIYNTILLNNLHKYLPVNSKIRIRDYLT